MEMEEEEEEELGSRRPRNGSKLPMAIARWCLASESEGTSWKHMGGDEQLTSFSDGCSGVRFVVHSRNLLGSSTAWGELQGGSTASGTLPSIELEEDGETLGYILQFVYPNPVQPRALAFPRDWRVIRALDKYSVNSLVPLLC
jgi:hypothetical protein